MANPKQLMVLEQRLTLLTKCAIRPKNKKLVVRSVFALWFLLLVFGGANGQSESPRPVVAEPEQAWVEHAEKVLPAIRFTLTRQERMHLRKALWLEYALTYDKAGQINSLRLLKVRGIRPPTAIEQHVAFPIK